MSTARNAFLTAFFLLCASALAKKPPAPFAYATPLDFDRRVLGAGKPVIVEVTASYCVYCHKMEAIFRALKAKGGLPDFDVVLIDREKYRSFIVDRGLTDSLPGLAFVRGENVLARNKGAMDEESARQWIEVYGPLADVSPPDRLASIPTEALPAYELKSTLAADRRAKGAPAVSRPPSTDEVAGLAPEEIQALSPVERLAIVAGDATFAARRVVHATDSEATGFIAGDRATDLCLAKAQARLERYAPLADASAAAAGAAPGASDPGAAEAVGGARLTFRADEIRALLALQYVKICESRFNSAALFARELRPEDARRFDFESLRALLPAETPAELLSEAAFLETLSAR